MIVQDQRNIIVERAVDLIERAVGHRFSFEERYEVTFVLEELQSDTARLAAESGGSFW